MEYRNERRTNVHRHLSIVFDSHDINIKCGQKVAHIENDGLGQWQNADLNKQFEIVKSFQQTLKLATAQQNKKIVTQSFDLRHKICFI